MSCFKSTVSPKLSSTTAKARSSRNRLICERRSSFWTCWRRRDCNDDRLIQRPVMTQMIPFVYGSYYDVPRTIVLRYNGRALLLQSAFDEEADEYEPNYSVYALPESAEAALA